MIAKKFELRIDELILEGVPYDQRQRILAAIDRELTRLLLESSNTRSSWGDERCLPLHEVDVNPHWTPERIGRHVAQSTYQQIGAMGTRVDAGISKSAPNTGNEKCSI